MKSLDSKAHVIHHEEVHVLPPRWPHQSASAAVASREEHQLQHQEEHRVVLQRCQRP